MNDIREAVRGILPALGFVGLGLAGLFWLLFVPAVTATLARAKERTPVGWGILGLLFGPFTWIVAFLPSLPPPQPSATKRSGKKSKRSTAAMPSMAQPSRRSRSKRVVNSIVNTQISGLKSGR